MVLLRDQSTQTVRSVDVVIPCHTLDRWSLLLRAVRSVHEQTTRPGRIVVTVDHNPELFERCRREWDGDDADADADADAMKIEVVQSRYPGRQGSSRNTALEHCTAEIVVFLDDDAAAQPDWLATLVAVYDDERVYAVGGAALPEYATRRPRWFPASFDWVFGCHYDGLPEQLAPTRHLIGTTMSIRREPFVALGGFHTDDFDDMDLSHRVAHAHGAESVLYQPEAVVRHHVGADRLTWRYFWRRCYFVNRGKAAALADMGQAGHFGAELGFALRLSRALPGALRALLRLDVWPFVRFLVACLGLTLAGAGFTVGRVELALGRRSPQLTVGLDRAAAAPADASDD